jgi:ribonucleoside-diphosphate reductase alpha chain
VDFEALASRVRVAVKYLDRVVDITEYPTTEASASNSRWRPVGLGLMGLQDVFFQLRISFDSPEASELSARIQEEVYFAALTTSADLAEAHGAHPSFHETRAAAGHLQFDLWGVTPSSMGPGKQVSLFGTSASSTDRWAKLRQRIQVVGLRNSLLVAIAPTTAIAAISECYECTEPQVSNLAQRETLSGSFLQINRYLVEDLKRLDLWTPQLRALIEEAKGSIQGIQEVPEALRTLYRTAWELPQQALIDMAAARSPYIDQSASLNLFLAEPTIAELSSMYAYAWKKGLKTTYYLRSHRQTPSADDALLTDEDTVSSASVAVSSPAAELRADTPPSTATEQELSATGPAALTADAGSPYPNALSQFVVTRSYLRWREEDGRRETYAEAVSRYCDFVSGARDVPPSVLQDIREGMLSMGVLPSMRALWSAGPAAGRDNTMIYNCSFLPLDNLRAFGEMLYILMMGTGVGYSVEREFVANLPAVAPRSGRMIPYTIADSTVGWADAVFDGLTHMWQGHTVDFDYSLIRPEGARCKTKGGRASGPKPLRLLLEFCQGVIDTASGRQLRSIEVSDIACMIGEIVKAGGVRRAALICFSDPEDDAMRHAKDWRRGSFPECRYMANISAFWSSKPKRKVFDREWDALRNSGSGERGFYMVPSKRREERQGELRSNPCGEILLRYAKAECPWTGRGGGGQFCNLSAAVLRQEDTRESFAAKIRTATWIGALQASFTNFPYLRPAWKQHCNEDRLLGVDITGHCDNPALSNDTEAMTYFNQVALETAAAASKHLGISMPASVTCGKPSGNSSQAVDCASGFHTRYADFYIRRVRVSANDPLYHLVRDSGAPVFKDVKYKNGPDEDCPTWVVEFPVKAPEGCMTRDDETALEQLARYLHIMRTWCSERGHNQSATVYVREDEWGPVGDWLYEHFDEVTGLSFLPYDGGKYELAPYEEITEAEYLSRVRDFPVLDYKLLSQYETEDMGQGAQTLACVGGSCEIDYETLTPAEDAAQ